MLDNDDDRELVEKLVEVMQRAVPILELAALYLPGELAEYPEMVEHARDDAKAVIEEAAIRLFASDVVDQMESLDEQVS